MVKNWKVVILDDQSEDSRLMQFVLLQHEAQFFVTPDPDHALKIVRALSPELVIGNAHLPGMAQLIQKLKADPQVQYTNLILLAPTKMPCDVPILTTPLSATTFVSKLLAALSQDGDTYSVLNLAVAPPSTTID